MSQIVKGWLATAALGAGTIHIAVAVSTALPFAIVFVVIGLAELLWAFLTLIRDDVPFARIARFAALTPVLIWALLLVASTLGLTGSAQVLPLVPMALGSLFTLFIAITLSLQLRRGRDAAAASAPAAGRYLLGLAAGAVVVGAITTPALAASEAGKTAVSHGQHGSTEPAGHDSH